MKKTAKYRRKGRWSTLRRRFLEENRPKELEQMEKEVTLAEFLSDIEIEYSERFSRMEDDQLKRTQLEIRYGTGEINWQTYVGEFNQLRNSIYELLTEDLCQ